MGTGMLEVNDNTKKTSMVHLRHTLFAAVHMKHSIDLLRLSFVQNLIPMGLAFKIYCTETAGKALKSPRPLDMKR